MAVAVTEAFKNAETIVDGIDAIAQWARSNPAIPEHERRSVLYRLESLRTAAFENRKFVLKCEEPKELKREEPKEQAPTKNPPKPSKAPVFEK